MTLYSAQIFFIFVGALDLLIGSGCKESTNMRKMLLMAMAAAAAVRVCCDRLETLPFSWTSILKEEEKR